MTDSMDEKEVLKYLAAFADGELDVQQNLRVLEHMAMNPTATKRAVHQQQLRLFADQAIRNHTPATPEHLKQKIRQLVKEAPPAQDTPSEIHEAEHDPLPKQASVLSKIGRWAPVAAAALFFISALAVLNYTDHPASPVSNARYAAFVTRHTNCSRMTEKLMNMQLFPQNLKDLPESLKQYLGGRPTPGLDLSAIGYEFYAVGECNVPGKKSVHLIYHAKDDPDQQHALSLWIRRHTGSPDIEADRPYLVTGPDTSIANPIILWRKGDMIYYLVGDSLGNVGRAASVLRLAG